MKRSNIFNTMFLITWLATILFIGISIPIIAEGGGSTYEPQQGVVTFKNPTSEELSKLVPGDRILLKTRENINQSKLAMPLGFTWRNLNSSASMGSPYDLLGKEVKIHYADPINVDNIVLQIRNINNDRSVWIDTELVAEITFLIKVKEPRIVRRAYGRYFDQRQKVLTKR